MVNDINALIFKDDAPDLDAYLKSEIKKSIVVKSCSEYTHIFALAIHPSKNKLTSIVFREKSSPITGCTYDAKFGEYYVDCADSMDLGTIPISFSIRVDKISRWECRIPMNETVIKKYLDSTQIEALKVFKDKNKGCKFDFIQLVSCY